MKKIFLLSLILVFAVSSVSFSAVSKKKTTTKTTAKTTTVTTTKVQPAPAPEPTVAERFTISPKLSYVGWLGIGVEFSPLYKITKDINLMGEVNWDFWAWSGSAGYIYGELNAVYNAQPFKVGEGAMPLKPYVGGGLLYGVPMGNAWNGGTFSAGLGFAIFGGVTGQYGPYTWFGQLKFANAPITWKYAQEASINALGVGMEWGIRLPL
jgi:hypothetical protein